MDIDAFTDGYLIYLILNRWRPVCRASRSIRSANEARAHLRHREALTSLTHISDEERKTRGTSDPETEIKYLHQQNEHLFRSLHFHIYIPSAYFCSCTTATLLIRDGLEYEISHGTHCQLSAVELPLSFHGFTGTRTVLLPCTSPVSLVLSCLCNTCLIASRTFHSHTLYIQL